LPDDRLRLSRTPADYLAINDAISKLVSQLQPATLRADVFLYYPIELLNAAYHPALRPWEAGAKPKELLRVAEAYHSALGSLLDAGIMPCLVDGQMLREVHKGNGPAGRYRIRQAEADAIVIPAGCELPTDCRPAIPCEIHGMTPELPGQLFEQGRTRILKDNPEVCAGVLQDGTRTLVTLVNLTDREQTCRIRTRRMERTALIGAYQCTLEVEE
jgi:hypothetical protein